MFGDRTDNTNSGGRRYFPLHLIVRAARAAAAHYRSVPASVLYPQLVLGFGWLRGAVAHVVSARWWSGAEVLDFLDANEATRLPVYEPFADLFVRPVPVVIAVVVAVLQVLIGLALLLNLRPIAWLLVGLFLNIHFIMAGSVNPSVFYVVMGMAVLLSTMWDRMTADKAYRVAVRSTVMAVAGVVICGPFITTFDPARVIEDPSLIIICLSSLFAVSCWMMYGQLVEGDRPAAGATTTAVMLPPAGRGVVDRREDVDDQQSASVPGDRRYRGARRGVDSGPTSLETDLQELRAASPAEIMEAMDRPIPRLPSKETMSYHEDVDTGFSIREIPDSHAHAAAAAEAETPIETDTLDDERPRSIANFEVSSNEALLNWYSVRCHFRVDGRHFEERITVWQAVGFDDAIDLAEAEAEAYATTIDGEYLGSCDCFHLPDAAMKTSQGAEIYSLVRSSELDPDTYLRTFFFTGSERSAEV
jgi:hypothetical protein